MSDHIQRKSFSLLAGFLPAIIIVLSTFTKPEMWDLPAKISLEKGYSSQVSKRNCVCIFGILLNHILAEEYLTAITMYLTNKCLKYKHC